MSSEMREPTYYLLAALMDGPLHGYAIAKEAEELSDGRVRLTAGTLYGALDRLVSQGLIEAAGEETVEGRKRRSYKLTDRGLETLLEESTRLRRAAEVVATRAATAPTSRAAGA